VSDLVTFGETMLRLSAPQGERLERADELEVFVGGAESNTAIAAERLGAVSTWLSALPDSPLGRRVAGELRSHGIDTEIVWTEEGRQGLYFLEHGGEPRGTNVLYDRADTPVGSVGADQFDPSVFDDARLFYTSGITPALSEQARDTTYHLLQGAREAGLRTAMDVNYRSKLWSPEEANATLTKLFPALDVLFVAIRDAREVLGYEGNATELANHLIAEYDLQTVVVTRGEHGALAIHDGVVHDHDVYDADTHDPIGTGDAFVGAFLARRLSGDDVGRALDYAAATASYKRTIAGDVASVTKTEVEDLIERGAEDVSR
jgi:2-dehydro-3-deoxygluconokinase